MKKHISKACLFIAMLLAITACTGDFEEMNTDPNRLTSAPYPALLTNAINSVCRTYTRTTQDDGWARFHVRDVYVHDDRYQFDGGNSNFNYYDGHLKDLQMVMRRAEAAEDFNSVAIAKILTAYAYQIITDRFGDIPYSEALMADADPPIIYPKYDSQQSIYKDLIVQLKAANGMIDMIAGGPGGADILFKGNMMKWKKFCNSLLIRVYMRMSIVDPATAKTGIEEVIGNPSTYPIISSNADNAFMSWIPGDANYRSPFWQNPAFYAAQEKVVSKSIVDYLKARDDSRLTVYARPSSSAGEYVGLELGTLGQNTPDLSILGVQYFISEDTPTRLMAYSEVLFIIAEAAQNGSSVGMSAKAAYEAAITASFEQYNLTVPAGYFANPLVNFDGGKPKAELIGDQKWLALFPDGVQGWAEVRRTGYPVYVATTEPVGTLYPGLGVIKRYPYPFSEATDNPENLAAAKAAQPGIIEDKFGKGVWWDVE